MAYKFNLPLSDFNATVLPDGSPPKSSEGFGSAVHSYLAHQFDGFDGDAQIVVTETDISVEWEPKVKGQSPLDAALDKLNVGDLEPAITMLELLSRKEPQNLVALYNLGMAHSDVGNLAAAIRHLSDALEVDPSHINARVALGVALARARDYQAAVYHLQTAVDAEPSNPWAHRNLAAVMVRVGRGDEAVKHYRWAIEANPDDQQAHLGLADSLRKSGDLSGADEEYRRVVEIDSTTRFAEIARTSLSEIAESKFHEKSDGEVRQDVVLYCLAALEKFDGMPKAEVQKIVYEIAILGTKGLDINDPEEKYTLGSMPAKFSGTHLLSYLFVGFKIISPDQDYPFDLSREYEAALEMFEKRKGGCN